MAKTRKKNKPVVVKQSTPKTNADENFKFLNIRFPKELAANLTTKANERHVSVSSFIRDAVTNELVPKPEPAVEEVPVVQEEPVVKRDWSEVRETLLMVRDSETLTEYAARVGLEPIAESNAYIKLTPELQACIFLEVENALRFRSGDESRIVICALAEVLGNVTNLDYIRIFAAADEENHVWSLNDFVASKALWDEPGRVESLAEVLTPWLIRNYAVILGYTLATDGREAFLLKAEGFARALGLLGLAVEKQNAFFKLCTQCELEDDGQKGTIPTVIGQIEAVFA